MATRKKKADNLTPDSDDLAVAPETPENAVPVDIKDESADTTAPASAEQVDQPAEETAVPAADVIDKMVLFRLADQRYSIAINNVQEIQQIVAFSEVPSTGPGLVGMINLRGNVIPALDIRSLLGMSRLEYHLDTPMIICRTRGHLVALIVDEVEDVVALPEGCLAPPPQVHGLADRMIGVCRMESYLVYLLDVDRIMAPVDLVSERS